MTGRTLENKTIEEIKPGDTASITKTLTKDDLEKFAVCTWTSTLYIWEGYAKKYSSGKIAAQSFWSVLVASSLLGSELPGPGTINVSQSLDFMESLKVGDTITLTMRDNKKKLKTKVVSFDCFCRNRNGETVMTGSALVIPPAEKVSVPRSDSPEIIVKTYNKYEHLRVVRRDR